MYFNYSAQCRIPNFFMPLSAIQVNRWETGAFFEGSWMRQLWESEWDEICYANDAEIIRNFTQIDLWWEIIRFSNCRFHLNKKKSLCISFQKWKKNQFECFYGYPFQLFEYLYQENQEKNCAFVIFVKMKMNSINAFSIHYIQFLIFFYLWFFVL